MMMVPIMSRPRRSMVLPSMLFVVLLLIRLMGQKVSAEEPEEGEQQELESWQGNYLYMAPTKKHGTGWGVFAATSFKKGDVVDVTPMFLPLEDGGEAPIIMETILNNYHAERWVRDELTETSHSVLFFGSSLFVNDGGEEKQNVELIQFADADVAAFGHYAVRDIAAGEEILANYGDRGSAAAWINEQRELHAAEEDDPSLGPEDVELYMSKIYAGHGAENCDALFDAIMDDPENRTYDMEAYIQNRVAPEEAGYRNAMAKVAIKEEGVVLEIVPALIVSKEMVLDTVLEPIVLFWNDLDAFSVESTDENGEESSNFPETLEVLYYPSSDETEESSSKPRYEELNREEQTVLLPLGGNLALLERTTSEDPEDYNCRLEDIYPDRWNSQAVTIRIVSTRPIAWGERLVLHMAGQSSSEETSYALYKELIATGQPLTPAPEGLEEEETVDGEEF